MVKQPANPTRSGYTFVEWQLNGKAYNFNSKVSGNITLKATWKQNSQQPTEKHVTSVSISGNTNIKVGETSQLTATVTPADADAKYKVVTWSSSRPEVASVDPSSGLVTGVKAGSTVITATTADGKTTSVNVTVTGNSYNIRITLNKTAEGMTSYTYKVEVFKDGQAFTGYKGFTVDGKVQYKAGSGTLGEGQVGQLSNSSKAVITLSDGTKVDNVSVEIIKN